MSTQPSRANPAISLSTALEPYVDVKRAASYLSVAVKTLNEWARLEKIPAYPWGDGSRKTWRFKLSELDVSPRRPNDLEGLEDHFLSNPVSGDHRDAFPGRRLRVLSNTVHGRKANTSRAE